jgi:hypothetical protein
MHGAALRKLGRPPICTAASPRGKHMWSHPGVGPKAAAAVPVGVVEAASPALDAHVGVRWAVSWWLGSTGVASAATDESIDAEALLATVKEWVGRALSCRHACTRQSSDVCRVSDAPQSTGAGRSAWPQVTLTC